MLRFILGPAASGKTYHVLQNIRECVNCGQQVVLLVPEQFSFESEKAVLDVLGDRLAQAVSVMSFTRLCDEIERETGGLCSKSVSEADKIILMRRAIKQAAPELKRWQKYSSSAGFAKTMVDTISEFKLNAVSPDDLLHVAEKTSDISLSSKLCDTSAIYSYYNALLSNSFSDPSDRLEALYKKLEYHRFFKDKTVFIDSFKSFTGCQIRILDRIIAQSRDITVSLSCDNESIKQLDVFSGVRKTMARIKKIAVSHNIVCGEDIVLNSNHYNSPDLKVLERLMATSKFDSSNDCPNITVCKAQTHFDEAEFVARTIRKTVREKGARYRDFVIIARDTAPYEEALSSACAKNNVPCFIDRPFALSALPPARAAASAIDAALKPTTEKLLNFHKSGLDILSAEELSLLENYTYLWNIDGYLWENEWNMHPKGLVSEEPKSSDVQALNEINRLRTAAASPIFALAKSFKGSAANMAAAIIHFFDKINAKQAFLKLYNEHKATGNAAFADALRQGFDETIRLLESLVLCFGDSEITPTEFFDAFKTAAALTTVGVTPQTLDEAIFGAADRIRPSRPKYAFILGANQGVFPKTPSPSGIFSNKERRELIDLELAIPDKTIDAAIDESFLVYTNLCCPTNGLFISYSSLSIEGNSLECSSFVNEIISALDCNKVSEPEALSTDNLPETAEAAFSELCRRITIEKADAKAIEAALPKEYESRIDAVNQSITRQSFSISEQTALKLFGEKLHMSPSRFDNFSRCKFMFFCKDGLRLRRLQPADFDALQRGTLVHFVLQRIIETYGKNLSLLSETEISAAVDSLTEEYLDSVTGYRSIETPRSKYLVSILKRSVNYVALRLSAELKQSQFEPIKCELKIGAGEEIPEIVFPIEKNRELLLSGTVDRVDSWNGYIRIIDYKTGHRDFKLPDILFGQNMQMLIYLYAVCGYMGDKSAGIFYMPARRIKAGAPKDRRMSGIMPMNEELVYAMESANGGQFIPKLTANPSDSFIPEEDFDKIFDFIERKLKTAGKNIFSGDISASPIDGLDSDACKYCDFAAVCRIEDEKHLCVPKLSNAEVISMIEKEAEEHGF